MTAASPLLRLWTPVCLVLAFAFAVPAFAEDQVIKSVLDSYRRELSEARDNLEVLNKRLHVDIPSIQSKAARINKKRDQLVLLFGSAQSPWDLRDVLEANKDMLSRVETLIIQPESLDRELLSGIATLQGMEGRISVRLQENVPGNVASELKDLLKEIADLTLRVSSVRATLNQGLAPVRELRTNLGNEDERIRQELWQIWPQYYGSRTDAYFKPELPDVFVYEVRQWVKWTEFLAGVAKSSSDTASMRKALLGGAGVSLGFGLLLWILCRRKTFSKGAPITHTAMRNALVCGSTAAGLVYLAGNGPPVLYSITMSIAEVLLTAGLVFLSMHFTFLHSQVDEKPKTFTRWPLWGVFSLGLLLQSLRVPEIVLQPVLAVVLATLAWNFRSRDKASLEGVDRFLSTVCTVCLLLLLAIVGYGYCRAAILAVSCLFYFVLSVRFSHALSDLLDTWQQAHAAKWSPLLSGLVAGTGFPLVFLCSFSLCLWLASIQFEGQLAFSAILNYEARFQSFSVSLGRLAIVLFGYYVVLSAVRASKKLLAAYGNSREDIEAGAVQSLQTIASYAWWGLFGLVSLWTLGFSFTSLAVVAGGLSVGIGFGLQQIVNNFISGLILLFGRSVEVGDVLQIGDISGVVHRVNIRNTVVQTFDNATIFVPNSTLVTNQIVNWSHRDRRVRRDVNIGVAYGTDRQLVSELLVQAALSVPEVLREPPPNVLFWEFGQSSLDFKLRVWIADVSTQLVVLSNVRDAVARLLEANGVEIAFPQSDIHLRSAPALDKLAASLLTAMKSKNNVPTGANIPPQEDAKK